MTETGRRHPIRSAFVRRLAALACLVFATSGIAQAQAPWPSRPVRVIIPFGPGSATDIVARVVSEGLQAELGQPFVVDNRAGANGFIAAEAAARAPADGYTLFISSNTTQTSNQYLFKKLPYDPVKDFVAIGGINEGHFMLTVNSGMPVRSVAEFVAWLKANPGKGSYGYGATVSQIAAVGFLKEVGANAVGVAYKSSPQVATDLIGGHLTFTIQGVTSGLQFVKSGRMKALMVSAPERLPQLPQVPTGSEVGVPGFVASSFVGLFAPAETPEDTVERLSAALQRVLRRPDMVERMNACCAGRPIPATPAGFAEYLRRDRERWASGVAAAGIQPE